MSALLSVTEYEHLLCAVTHGDVTLFLGEDIINGCSIGDQRAPVLYRNNLRDRLQHIFLQDELFSEHSLRDVCRKIELLKGADILRQTLIDLMTPVNPSSTLLSLTEMVWRAIYTTNVDDALEQAYALSDNPAQRLMPVVSRNDQMAQDVEAEVSYYKFHGCLKRSVGIPLFTHRDYTTAIEKYNQFFTRLVANGKDSPWLFLGFREDECKLVLETVVKNIQMIECVNVYVVMQQPNQEFMDFASHLGISVISSDLHSFVPWMIEHAANGITLHKEKGSVLNSHINRRYGLVLEIELIAQMHKSFCFAHANMEYLHQVLHGAVKSHWEAPEHGIAELEGLESRVIDDVERWLIYPQFRSTMVTACAGKGKASFMMHIIAKVMQLTTLCELLFFKYNTDFNVDALCQYVKTIGVPVILIVDDVFHHAGKLNALKAKATQMSFPVYILGVTRPSSYMLASSAAADETKSKFVITYSPATTNVDICDIN